MIADPRTVISSPTSQDFYPAESRRLPVVRYSGSEVLSDGLRGKSFWVSGLKRLNSIKMNKSSPYHHHYHHHHPPPLYLSLQLSLWPRHESKVKQDAIYWAGQKYIWVFPSSAIWMNFLVNPIQYIYVPYANNLSYHLTTHFLCCWIITNDDVCTEGLRSHLRASS